MSDWRNGLSLAFYAAASCAAWHLVRALGRRRDADDRDADAAASSSAAAAAAAAASASASVDASFSSSSAFVQAVNSSNNNGYSQQVRQVFFFIRSFLLFCFFFQ